MADEHIEAARIILDQHGKEGGLGYINQRLGDVRRSGDAEIIDYWRGVMGAFRSMTG